MKIVSGRTGSPHVTSQQFRQMLEGIIGQGSYIVTSGENLKPELSSNNTLKIRSGMMCHHGCVSSVDIGTYDEVTLTNGSQGMKRIDLIVNRHTRNSETEIENCEWKVIMGTPAASNPIVPGYTAGNLQNGDTVDECPVFQVSYDGINVTAVKSLLETVGSLTELNSKSLKIIDVSYSSVRIVNAGYGVVEISGINMKEYQVVSASVLTWESGTITGSPTIGRGANGYAYIFGKAGDTIRDLSIRWLCVKRDY